MRASRGCGRSLPPHRLARGQHTPFFGNLIQQRLLGIGKFAESLGHQDIFQLTEVDLQINLFQQRRIHWLADLIGKRDVAFADRLVGGRWIRLDVRPRQSTDIFGSSEQFVGGIGCSFEERGGAPRDSEQQSLFCVLGV